MIIRLLASAVCLAACQAPNEEAPKPTPQNITVDAPEAAALCIRSSAEDAACEATGKDGSRATARSGVIGAKRPNR